VSTLRKCIKTQFTLNVTNKTNSKNPQLATTISMGIFNLFGQGKKTVFKFTDPESKACFTCDHVLNRDRPILYAAHDQEGDWQFLCGHEDHTDGNAKVISLKQATELDPTVNDLYDMPLNVGAERKSVQDKWQPFRMSTE